MLNAILIFTGSVVGAGFASGQEIQLFFKTDSDILSVILSVILFTVCPMKVYLDTYRLNIQDYKMYLKIKTGVFAGYFSIISVLFSLSAYCIMICGINTVFENSGVPLTGIAFSFLCLFIFLRDMKGLAVLNVISAPIIILGIFLTTTKSIQVFSISGINGAYYASYNILSCLPVLVSFRTYFKTKKHAMLTSLISGVITGMLIYLIYIAIPSCELEMPMLAVADKINMRTIYTLILVLAMLTTAASSGMCFIKSLGISRLHSALLLTSISVFLLPFSFSEMVEKLFGFFGIASSPLILFILLPVRDNTRLNR